MCGIGSVPVNALRVHRLGGPVAAAREVWNTVESISPSSIGGPAMVERLAGSVCPTCSEAVSSAGGVGVTRWRSPSAGTSKASGTRGRRRRSGLANGGSSAGPVWSHVPGRTASRSRNRTPGRGSTFGSLLITVTTR